MRRLEPAQSCGGLSGREILLLLALLAGGVMLLWPVLRGKQQQKARVVSLRNLQQWGIALNLHLMDNDQQLPAVGLLPISPEPSQAWYNALPTYLSREPLGALQPDKLPDEDSDSIWVDPSAAPPPGADGFFFSYGMNRFLQPDPAAPSYKVYDLTAPGSTIFLTETASLAPGLMPEEVEFRHTNPAAGSTRLAHVLFCDGHVSFGSRFELAENPQATEPEASLAPLSWAPFVGAPRPQ